MVTGNVCPRLCTIENNKFIQSPEARSEWAGRCCFSLIICVGVGGVGVGIVGNKPPGTDGILLPTPLGECARADAASLLLLLALHGCSCANIVLLSHKSYELRTANTGVT